MDQLWMVLGEILLTAGLLSALAGAVMALLAILGLRVSIRWARSLAWVSFALALATSALLMALILAQRYGFAYIYQYSSQDLPLAYRLSAFWAGQAGSILLWLLLGSVFTVLQVRRSRQFEPYVLLFLLLVQAGLTLFMLVDVPIGPPSDIFAHGSGPFRLLGVVVQDGAGLNPLLQNPWMVAHPPVLFVGYAGLAVPFAYALAGLWRRDYDGWVRPALPWALLGWFFLGLGIYLGAYWSYETLGWGGYWGWDPVENSSAVPWFTATALIHCLIVQRYRQRLRQGNFLLAISTFLLVLLATYLTRSGLLNQFSNHSFVESGLNPWMIGVQLVMLGVSLFFLVSRWSDIPRSPVFVSDVDAGPLQRGAVVGSVGRNLPSWFSRDFSFLLATLLLLVMAAVILVGTLAPVVTPLFGRPVAVGVSYYPLFTGPILAILLLVLILCPLLGWRESDWRILLRFVGGAAAFSAVVTVASVLLGAHSLVAVLFIFLAGCALAVNAIMIARTLRGGFLRLGGYLAHVGLGLLVVGIVASTMYGADRLLELRQGQAEEALGYQVSFLGWQESPGDWPALRLDVTQGDATFTARPRLFASPQDQSVMAIPDVHRYLTHDLYISAEGYDTAGGLQELLIVQGGMASAAGYSLTLQGIVSDTPYYRVVLAVEAPGIRLTITPTVGMAGTTAVGSPAALPGGEVVQVEDATPFGADWPAGYLLLLEGQPTTIGDYQVTLRDFSMQVHDQEGGTIAAGAVLDFLGPAGLQVITPTQVSAAQGLESPPVQLSPGVTVSLVQMSIGEQPQSAIVEIAGLDVPRQQGLAWLLVGSAQSTAVAFVRLSIKPGMNVLWVGGVLLLAGTGLAAVRRALEVKAGSSRPAVPEDGAETGPGVSGA